MRMALLISLILLASVPAAQADIKVSRKVKAKARKLVKSGDLNYRMARFKDALPKYQAAYKIYEHPAILFNIAQCHRQLGDKKKALFFYKLYLADWRRSNPNPPYLKEVNGHIGKLDAALEAQARKAKEEQLRKERERKAELERARLAQERKDKARLERERKDRAEQARKARLALAPVPKPKPTPRPIYKKWWFWTAIGVVVVGGTTAVVVAAQPGDPVTVGGSMGSRNDIHF